MLACTTPFRLPAREQAFIAWAGLRGGVPIVFATIPIAAGLASGVRVFDVVFYVVIVSVAAQGLTLRMAAHRLGVVETRPVPHFADLDVATLQTLGAELIELAPGDLAIADGTEIRQLFLPGAAIIVAIRRDDALVVPRGDSELLRRGPPLPARRAHAARRAAARPRDRGSGELRRATRRR